MVPITHKSCPPRAEPAPDIPALVMDQIEGMSILMVDLDDFRGIWLFCVLPLPISDLHFCAEAKLVLEMQGKFKENLP